MNNQYNQFNMDYNYLPIFIKDIQNAWQNLKGVINFNTLDLSNTLSQLSGMEIYLFRENLQKTGSFKIRGAYNKISSLTHEERKAGIVTFSSGNHGQAIAWACRHFGVRSTIVMPDFSPKCKIKAARAYGAKVIISGNNSEDAYRTAREISNKSGSIIIHPMDDTSLIAGHGTIGLDILNQLPDVNLIVVPVSGGSLISGILCAVKELSPLIKVIGVQPIGANAMFRSLKDGKLVELSRVNTIADGLTAKRPGELTFKIISRYVDDMVLVTDEEMLNAVIYCLNFAKIVVEPAGAASVAAILTGKITAKKKKCVCIVSGGNIEMGLLQKGIEKQLLENRN